MFHLISKLQKLGFKNIIFYENIFPYKVKKKIDYENKQVKSFFFVETPVMHYHNNDSFKMNKLKLFSLIMLDRPKLEEFPPF